MLFNSFEFLIFLPIVFLLYWFVFKPLRWQNLFIVAVSYIFYGWWDWRFLILIAFTTLCSFASGIVLERLEGQRTKQKWVSAANITLNLLILCIFKYFNFFGENLTELFQLFGVEADWVTIDILLPVGISFYTFQILSYQIDVYRGEVSREDSFLKFATYVSMFPKLISGPITRYGDISDSLTERTFTVRGLEDGMKLFILGLAAKGLLADRVGILWHEVQVTGFESISTPLAWLAAIAYSMEIYFDFWGYSLMAMGLGRMMGIELPANFRRPYMARSVRDFYRRWHMTLGQWFCRYVYIPLGGSRQGELRTIFNLLVVWMLTGIWHGAGWNFALWGLYFGVFLSAEKLIGKKWKERSFKIADVSANNDSNGGNRKNMFLICARNSIEHGYVLLVVLFSFVIFRVEGVREIKEQFLGLSGCYGNVMTPMAAYEIKSCLILLLIACAGATPFPAMWVQRLKNTNMWKKSGWLLQSCYILTGLVLATAFLLGSSVHPFLYFRF